MATARFDNQDGRLRGRGLQARRLKKWTEAVGKCAKCHRLTNYADPRVDPNGFHLDHIAMLEKSKDDSEENTQVLCVPCHDKKTMQDMGYRERLEFDKEGRVKW
jgi:5-methylcytosine-specific restriction protein A